LTAPFSTCGLLTLLAHRTHDLRTTVFATFVLVVTDPDALSVAPEIKRLALGKPVLSRILFTSATLTARAGLIGRAGLAACDPWQRSRPAHECVARPTVLRL